MTRKAACFRIRRAETANSTISIFAVQEIAFDCNTSNVFAAQSKPFSAFSAPPGTQETFCLSHDVLECAMWGHATATVVHLSTAQSLEISVRSWSKDRAGSEGCMILGQLNSNVTPCHSPYTVLWCLKLRYKYLWISIFFNHLHFFAWVFLPILCERTESCKEWNLHGWWCSTRWSG